MKTIPFFPYADLFKRAKPRCPVEIMVGVSAETCAYILQRGLRRFRCQLAKFMGV